MHGQGPFSLLFRGRARPTSQNPAVAQVLPTSRSPDPEQDEDVAAELVRLSLADPQEAATASVGEGVAQPEDDAPNSIGQEALSRGVLAGETALAARVEILTTEFASGWAAADDSGACAHVLALLGSKVIGHARASLTRADLDHARAAGTMSAYAFAMVFDSPIAPEKVESVQVILASDRRYVRHARKIRIERASPLRIFLFGSPRSGTSELGTSLTKVLDLPWLGEGHAAPLFSSAADSMMGDPSAANGLVRFMAMQQFRQIPICAARQAYFMMHASSSFLDKTPGMPMVAAAPFLLEAFPDGKFIFLRRNPVSNILSRMVKFGGSFESHCRDWSATMLEWVRVRSMLPHYIEIEQEDMLSAPDEVALKLAHYIGRPDAARSIGSALASGRRERTGAGVGKTAFSETDWTPEQIRTFRRICAPAMAAFDYRVDADAVAVSA